MGHAIVRILVVGCLTGTVVPARADDFGKFLREAARESVRGDAGLRPPAPGTAHRTNEARHYAVKTADGWALSVSRYPPRGAARPGAQPVILCHGLTYNATFWDLDPACSFAEYLAQNGFDVWTVNLRGCGLSQKWVWNLDEAPGMVVGNALRRLTRDKAAPSGFASLDPKFANWTMDDHIRYDVPALVNLVRRHTGAPQVTWVGHSMGGIVAICNLARYPNPGIGRLVTIGSQVTMPEGQVMTRFLQEMLQVRQGQVSGTLNGRALAARSQTSVHNLFFNEQNVSRDVYDALGSWATDVPALGLMEQYMVLSSRGQLFDARRQFNYALALGNVKVPVFISCGEQDRFAPPKVQQYLYNHVGSTDKTLVIFGPSHRFATSAGHDDTLVGLKSREEVYPVIARWLAEPH
jgi:pimeloyl-ACP methyl ester carboxylesterase